MKKMKERESKREEVQGSDGGKSLNRQVQTINKKEVRAAMKMTDTRKGVGPVT